MIKAIIGDNAFNIDSSKIKYKDFILLKYDEFNKEEIILPDHDAEIFERIILPISMQEKDTMQIEFININNVGIINHELNFFGLDSLFEPKDNYYKHISEQVLNNMKNYISLINSKQKNKWIVKEIKLQDDFESRYFNFDASDECANKMQYSLSFAPSIVKPEKPIFLDDCDILYEKKFQNYEAHRVTIKFQVELFDLNKLIHIYINDKQTKKQKNVNIEPDVVQIAKRLLLKKLQKNENVHYWCKYLSTVTNSDYEQGYNIYPSGKRMHDYIKFGCLVTVIKLV